MGYKNHRSSWICQQNLDEAPEYPYQIKFTDHKT